MQTEKTKFLNSQKSTKTSCIPIMKISVYTLQNVSIISHIEVKKNMERDIERIEHQNEKKKCALLASDSHVERRWSNPCQNWKWNDSNWISDADVNFCQRRSNTALTKSLGVPLITI